MEVIPVIGVSILGVAKIFALFALLLYIIFALVVIKQVGLMTSTIEVGLEKGIKIIAWVHLLFALAVFLTAIVIL